MFALMVLAYFGVRYDYQNKGWERKTGDSSSPAELGAKTEIPSVSAPANSRDFFPTASGTRWSYTIEFPTPGLEGLSHRVTRWPSGNGTIHSEEIRQRFYISSPAADGKYQLIMRVAKPSPTQGTLSYPEGYEIAIDRDDIGIYEYQAGVYWAIDKFKGCNAMQIVVYPPGSLGSRGNDSGRPGEAARFLFYAASTSEIIGISEENDIIRFVGVEKRDGTPCLHFRRTVASSAPSDLSPSDNDPVSKLLHSGFDEDLWYGKGIGLMKLIQTINGKPSMVWTLNRPPGRMI